MDWVDVAQDMGQRRALVNMIMIMAAQLAAFQEGLSSVSEMNPKLLFIR
jgi:hypothetical protein